MALAPQFAATARVGIGQVSTANPNRNGTGALVTVLTAGLNGTRVDYAEVKATGSSSSGVVRLYLHDGTTAHLLTEVEIPVVTVSGTQRTFEQLIELAGGLTIPTGWSLRASTEVGETFNVFAFGGDL